MLTPPVHFCMPTNAARLAHVAAPSLFIKPVPPNLPAFMACIATACHLLLFLALLLASSLNSRLLHVSFPVQHQAFVPSIVKQHP